MMARGSIEAPGENMSGANFSTKFLCGPTSSVAISKNSPSRLTLRQTETAVAAPDAERLCATDPRLLSPFEERDSDQDVTITPQRISTEYSLEKSGWDALLATRCPRGGIGRRARFRF